MLRLRLALVFCAVVSALGGGCTDSSEYHEPGPRPQIVTITGPKGSAVTCDPKVTGGQCVLPITVAFRLPAEGYVWKAYVRFQGDGGDDGVDRAYLLPQTFGAGDHADAVVNFDASIPPPILRRGALFTYSVRLVTGLGDESAASTLNVSVQ